MADDISTILTNANTLGGTLTPGIGSAFQSVMATVARQNYNARQSSELGQLGKQFDPTKVSGGTFADIIGWVEAKRGADIGKTYAATMDTYNQEKTTAEQKRQFNLNMAFDTLRFQKELKLSKQKVKDANAQFEANQKADAASAAADQKYKDAQLAWLKTYQQGLLDNAAKKASGTGFFD
jgi:hypothetical protein